MLSRYAILLIFTLICSTMSVSLATAGRRPFTPVNDERLHNAHIVTEKVISGAQPEGDDGFAALNALGVKTIISVDGARPDLARAGKYGMRYVHLPIGYDGVTDAEGRAIAKAIAELPGRIYVHCHHGRHRSAAAVAVGCVTNGTLEPQSAEVVLETFGTGLNYKGLWQAAKDAHRVGVEELKRLKIDFVEAAKVADLAARMVEVDRHWEHLKQVKSAGWKSPVDHPDLDPAHEALQMQEHFQESARLEGAQAYPHQFMEMLRTGTVATESLHRALTAQPVNTTAAAAAFDAVARSCVSCHEAYRD